MSQLLSILLMGPKNTLSSFHYPFAVMILVHILVFTQSKVAFLFLIFPVFSSVSFFYFFLVVILVYICSSLKVIKTCKLHMSIRYVLFVLFSIFLYQHIGISLKLHDLRMAVPDYIVSIKYLIENEVI